MAQKYTSANTCLRQVPKIFKYSYGAIREGGLNFDIGGGKYDLGTEYLWKRGVSNYVYDPFNRSENHNRLVLSLVARERADSVTIANVLNVIDDDEALMGVLLLARAMAKPRACILISVHEGNKSGVGRKTPRGYQRNTIAWGYREFLREAFPKDNIWYNHGVIFVGRMGVSP